MTFLTGLVPGHHGIIANRWFDPTTGRAGDYCTACFSGDYPMPVDTPVHKFILEDKHQMRMFQDERSSSSGNGSDGRTSFAIEEIFIFGTPKRFR